MKNLFALHNIYNRQGGPDDCGLACLSMLLNYTGRYKDGCLLLRSAPVQPGGLSLFDLKLLAANFQLNVRVVRMDVSTLRNLGLPTVLHTAKDNGAYHFVVCFGSKFRRGNWQYLIADPSTGISWLPESKLEKIWQNKAALFAEELKFRFPVVKDHLWITFINAFPKHRILLISIPVLHLCVTALGIALSWLLQRGINSSLTDRKDSILAALIILLLCILLARSFGNYLKQCIMIRLNTDIRQQFVKNFLIRLSPDSVDEAGVKKGLADILKIQNAVTALFAVLFSDGALVTLLMTALWYFEPFAGGINTVYIIIIILIGISQSAKLTREQAVLTDTAITNEHLLLRDLSRSRVNPDQLMYHLTAQNNYITKARSFAGSVNAIGLLYECCGTFAVIGMLIYCLSGVRQGSLSYNMLLTEVLVSYFITVLMPRVCQAFPVITEGARVIRQF